MNPAILMKLMSAKNTFTKNHPKFVAFLSTVFKNGVEEGTASYGKMVDFDTAFLTGYLADKFDVPSEEGKDRIRQRVDQSIVDQLQSSLLGYTTVVPTGKNLRIHHSRARYVLLPVWLLNTRYQDKQYTFAMNGQTGKMTGTFPVCPKRSAAWFGGICAGVTLVAAVIQLLM